VEDTLEAGIVLTGSEVKSLREGKANIAEAYVSPEQGELWLINCDIPDLSRAPTASTTSRAGKPETARLHKRETGQALPGGGPRRA
jgi:tmRNA-binding protein